LLALAGIVLLSPPPAAAPARPEADAVAAAVLRVDGLDAAALRAAIARREPGLQLRAAGEPAPAGLVAFVDVAATDAGVTVAVVLADGRAWRRRLRTAGAPAERAVARLLVQLFAAIAEQRLEPEQRGVPLPTWAPPADPPVPGDSQDARRPVPGDMSPVPPGDPSPGTPAPNSPAHAPPVPADSPPAHARPVPSDISTAHTPPVHSDIPPAHAAHTSPVPSDSPPTNASPVPSDISKPRTPPVPGDIRPAPPAPAPRLELGLVGELAAHLGLAPAVGLPPARGLGGGLRLDLRWRRGLAVTFGLRGLGRGRDGFELARLRGALGLAWAPRRGRFEGHLGVAFTLETWHVGRAGAPVYYREPGASLRPLLVGAALRAAPGLRLALGRGVALRLAAWVELAAGALPGGGAARLSRVADAGPPVPVFAVGGLELATGVELGVWLPARSR
jgi:hypothetical protein